MRNRHPSYLFADATNNSLGDIERRAFVAVESAPEDEVLGSEVDWFAASVLVNITAQPVVIGEPYQDEPEDTSVDVSGDFRYFTVPGESTLVPGRRYRIHYPCRGYTPLLDRRPGNWFSMFPRGKVHGNEIVFEYVFPGHDHGDELARVHSQNLELFNKYLSNANRDLESFLAQLPARLESAIRARQEKILKSRESASALGIPVVRKSVPFHTAPIIRARELVRVPPTRDPFEPVSMEEFNGILAVIDNAGRSIERSPRMTAGWDENSYRDNIVGLLNLAYGKTGSVTGETFVRHGKSDILIRHQDVDVFIGECKIWGGQAQVLAELNQLFDRYVTWSATKSAMIYFNKGKNMSDVVEHLKRVVPTHPRHVETAKQMGPTHLRYRFQHASDPKKVFDLAVLVFPV